MSGPKPGKEGLPYKDAADVIGAVPDNQPHEGLNPGHEIAHTSEVRPPKGK